jgi:hypothetical protein
MDGVLESLALLFPPLRLLHEGRNLYVAEVASLHLKSLFFPCHS